MGEWVGFDIEGVAALKAAMASDKTKLPGLAAEMNSAVSGTHRAVRSELDPNASNAHARLNTIGAHYERWIGELERGIQVALRTPASRPGPGGVREVELHFTTGDSARRTGEADAEEFAKLWQKYQDAQRNRHWLFGDDKDPKATEAARREVLDWLRRHGDSARDPAYAKALLDKLGKEKVLELLQDWQPGARDPREIETLLAAIRAADGLGQIPDLKKAIIERPNLRWLLPDLYPGHLSDPHRAVVGLGATAEREQIQWSQHDWNRWKADEALSKDPTQRDAFKRHQIERHGKEFETAAVRNGIPPDVLAGIAYKEIGNNPMWFDSAKFAYDPYDTSFGPFQIRISTAARALGYPNPRNLTREQIEAIRRSLMDTDQATDIAAKELARIKQEQGIGEFAPPDTPLGKEQRRRLALAYNGADDYADDFLKILPKAEEARRRGATW